MEGNGVTYEHFLGLERIPCASLLLRIEFASIDDDGQFISVRDPDPKIAKMAKLVAPPY